jgi:hypothetical protein
MENIERDKKPMPSIKPTGSRSHSQKSKNNDQTERATNSAKQSSKKSKKTKTEWITHYAYLNDKKREKLMELPDLPKPEKKKKRKYVDRRIRVDKVDNINLNEENKSEEKNSKESRSRSRSRSASSSSSSSSNKKDKNKATDSESSDDEKTSQKNKNNKPKKLLKRNSSGSIEVKKRSSSAVGIEHQLKKVSEYKKENTGLPFHFETKEKKTEKITFNPSKYNKVSYNEEELEELKELNKSYRESRKEVLSRRAKLDLDKMNIDYDLNYDLINAFNELEVRPVYKNLLRSIRSNL